MSCQQRRDETRLVCVTSKMFESERGTEILQSQLNCSEKRRRCTHRNKSPCLLRVDGKGGVVFLCFSVLSPSRQCVLFTLCVATPPAGGAQPMRRSLFVYILPPPRKGNKRSRESHFMEMCFFFLPLPLPFTPGTLGG